MTTYQQSTRSKPCSSAILSPKNPMWSSLQSNLGQYSERLANVCLGHDVAKFYHPNKIW
jgi:hypothetical protein